MSPTKISLKLTSATHRKKNSSWQKKKSHFVERSMSKVSRLKKVDELIKKLNKHSITQFFQLSFECDQLSFAKHKNFQLRIEQTGERQKCPCQKCPQHTILDKNLV